MIPVPVSSVSTGPGFTGLGCSQKGREKPKLSLYDNIMISHMQASCVIIS